MSVKDTISRKIKAAIEGYDFDEAIEEAIENIDIEELITDRLERKIARIDMEPLLTDLIGDYIDNALDEMSIEDDVLRAVQDAFEDL